MSDHERVRAEDVTLRAVAAEDLEAFFALGRDPIAVRMAAFTAADPDDRSAFDARWARIRADGTVAIRSVLVAGRVAGHVAAFGPPGEQEVTYWIARELWGRGVATRSLELFLEEHSERPLFARAAHDNMGSLRVLQRCGFVERGRERGYANARGREIEEVVLALS